MARKKKDTYEVLKVDVDCEDNEIFYIRYHPGGNEDKVIELKLNEWDFDNFVEDKKEV